MRAFARRSVAAGRSYSRSSSRSAIGWYACGAAVAVALVPVLDWPLAESFDLEIMNRRKRSRAQTLLLPTELIGERVSVKELDQRYTVMAKLDKHAEGSKAGTFGDAKRLADFVRGVGAYGQVVKARDMSGQMVAIKIIDEEAMPFLSLKHEVSALVKARKHPNVNELIEVLYCEETKSYYIVTSFCEGGELFDRLIDNGPYSEMDAALIFERIASALRHIHDTGYAHLDIKPENLLFTRKSSAHQAGEASDIRLIDFGMAMSLKNFLENGRTKMTSNVGTTPYLAPELLTALDLSPAEGRPAAVQKSNTHRHVSSVAAGATGGRQALEFSSDPRACDMYALGLVLYIMLLGCHPFDRQGNSQDLEIAARAMRGSLPDPGDEELEPKERRFTFDVHKSIQLSSGVRALLTNLLDPDPRKRLTARQTLRDPWVREQLRQSRIHHKPSPKESAAAALSSLTEVQRSVAVSLIAAALARGQIKRGDDCTKPMTKQQFLADAFGMLGAQDWQRLLPKGSKTPGGSSAPPPLSEFEKVVEQNTVHFDAGSTVFKRGDQVDGLFIVLDGEAQVEYSHSDGATDEEYNYSKSTPREKGEGGDDGHNDHHDKKHVVSVLRTGDFMGETGVLDGRDFRNATVRCVTPTVCVFWPREDFVRTIGGGTASALCEGIEEYIHRRQNARAFELLMEVGASKFQERMFRKGERIFTQDSTSDELYVLLEGQVETCFDLGHLDSLPKSSPLSMSELLGKVRGRKGKADDGCHDDKCVKLRMYNPGDLIGADAVIMGNVRSATACCLSDVRVLALKHRELASIFASESSLLRNLLRLSRRETEEKQAKLRQLTLPQLISGLSEDILGQPQSSTPRFPDTTQELTKLMVQVVTQRVKSNVQMKP